MGSKWIERDEETEIFGKKQFVLNVDQIKFTMVNVIIPPKWEFDIVSQFRKEELYMYKDIKFLLNENS